MLQTSFHPFIRMCASLILEGRAFTFDGKKNKDAVLLEVKADGLQGVTLPRTLSSGRRRAEGALCVFIGTRNC